MRVVGPPRDLSALSPKDRHLAARLLSALNKAERWNDPLFGAATWYEQFKEHLNKLGVDLVKMEKP